MKKLDARRIDYSEGIGDLPTDIVFATVAELAAGNPVTLQPNQVCRILERGDATWLGVAGGSADGFGLLDAGNSNTASIILEGQMSPNMWGCEGDEVTDDYDAYMAAQTQRKELWLEPESVYATTQEIEIFQNRRIIGAGDLSGFKWIGSAPVTPPDEMGGTSVLRFARPDPSTSALSNVYAGNFQVDINGTENLIGTSWIYTTVKSKGEYIRVINGGVNSFGHYYSKLWYCAFDGMSYRAGTGTLAAGSVGQYLSGGHGQINGIDFKNIQSHSAQVNMVLDTTSNAFTSIRLSGELENSIDNLKHEPGFGVKDMDVSGLYFEAASNLDINWKGPGATTQTIMVNWRSCQFNEAGSSVKIEEGNHRFEGCDRLLNLQNDGGRVWIDGSANIAITGTAADDVRHYPVVTAQDSGQAFSGTEAKVIIGASVAFAGFDPTAQSFPLPVNLLSSSNPSGGRTVEINIVGRIPSQGATKYWSGYLSQRGDNDQWIITKDTGSAEDANWTVAVNITTGSILVTYINGQPSTNVYVKWVPF